MYDEKNATCRGYSSYPVEPFLTCDTWKEDPEQPIEPEDE